jgi:hypothetical protein
MVDPILPSRCDLEFERDISELRWLHHGQLVNDSLAHLNRELQDLLEEAFGVSFVFSENKIDTGSGYLLKTELTPVILKTELTPVILKTELTPVIFDTGYLLRSSLPLRRVGLCCSLNKVKSIPVYEWNPVLGSLSCAPWLKEPYAYELLSQGAGIRQWNGPKSGEALGVMFGLRATEFFEVCPQRRILSVKRLFESHSGDLRKSVLE